MTTVMILKTGRCDAKCYNAKGHHCTCICGGINHGKGLKHAIQDKGSHFNQETKERWRQTHLFEELKELRKKKER